MAYTTLIPVATLAEHLADPQWAVVDCRFALAEPERGRRDYLQAHIPGAVYAHLQTDLSGAVIPGRTGRHPLPAVERFARTLSGWGIDADTQVVVYDDADGSMAVRLWWMIGWLGHDAVAVLDGGWAAWQAAGCPVAAGAEARTPRTFVPHPRPERVVDAAQLEAVLRDPGARVLDARGAIRYRGEQEPIDPVAGHIPGALSAPYAENVDAAGRFLAPEQLRARYQAVLGDTPAVQAVTYCGSGVTAAHDLLAMAHAGLGLGRLYAGSWSEWIADPTRPVAQGADR